MAENWRDIPGFEGLYEVSDKGRVRRLPRTTESGAILQKKFLTREIVDKYNHKVVHLRDADGKVRRWFVHRLVLLAFVGPCPEGMEICHNDGNGGHNELSNLRYDTRHNNNLDQSRMGRHNGQKLTLDEVRQVRKHLAEGKLSLSQIGRMYGITKEAVYKIKKGTSYGWLE